MYGLHSESSVHDIVYALILEVVFLGFATVFVGLGMSEIKKGKEFFKNTILILFGACLAGISIYVTYLFIQG